MLLYSTQASLFVLVDHTTAATTIRPEVSAKDLLLRRQEMASVDTAWMQNMFLQCLDNGCFAAPKNVLGLRDFPKTEYEPPSAYKSARDKKTTFRGPLLYERVCLAI